MRVFSRTASGIAGIALLTGALLACQRAEFGGPKAEEAAGATVKMPAIPKFDIPKPSGDTHSVREIRLNGGSLLDTEVKIKGYVTWIYDCAASLQGPDVTAEQAKKMIAERASLCRRPHFYLAESAEAPAHKQIWVVDVPRTLRPDESKHLTRAERAALPKVPTFAVGDEVVVLGKWVRKSQTGFARTNGLLVYQSMNNLSAATPTGTETAAKPAE